MATISNNACPLPTGLVDESFADINQIKNYNSVNAENHTDMNKSPQVI